MIGTGLQGGDGIDAMTVLRFFARRLTRLVLCLLAVSIITFGLLQLAPGSFAGIQAEGGGSAGLAGQQAQSSSTQLQTQYGDDVPVVNQYWHWLSGALHGDLGPSYKYPSLTVGHIVAKALPVSAGLAALALLLALIVALPLGVFAATRRGTVWDSGSLFLSTLGVAIPNYLAAIVLVLIFCLGLHALPTSGWSGPENLILPVLALAAAPAGLLTRYVRSSVLEVLREEYVLAARSKGGRWRTVMTRHVLRNSLIPLVTVAGPMLASLTVSTIFVETIFDVPGLGRYFTEAALSRDMPLLMGSTMVFATIVIGLNVLVDLLYGLLDPRTRAGLGLTGNVSRAPSDTTPLGAATGAEDVT